MTKAVIDLLEAVDVDIEQSYRATRTFGTGNRALQQMLELHAIRDLGERIDAGEKPYPLLRFAALRNVLRSKNLRARLIVRLFYQ